MPAAPKKQATAPAVDGLMILGVKIMTYVTYCVGVHHVHVRTRRVRTISNYVCTHNGWQVDQLYAYV